MDAAVLRNFRRHLLPLAGSGPLTCLQLGVRNPSHAVWLLENVVVCCDDRWYGTDDFRGSAVLHATALEVLGGFTNARLWARTEQDFLRSMPPEAEAGLRKGASLVYLDGTRDLDVMEDLLLAMEDLVQPNGILVINGYRTRRRRDPEVCEIVDDYLGHANPWHVIWDNTQIGVRRTNGPV